MTHKIMGTVKWFDASKGYGYIDAGIEQDVFVYYQSITNTNSKNLSAGDQVEFSVTRKPSGPVANEVARK